ncbi:unnamed protein product [Pleuronectes platessa]|uniref:Uncharacterized protein n=1 Tax=Pleuronectes platessa TaxID=8262 RepID=A0A9N7VK94_PLEPL|nr:unnamed protein product [Pleuronectes platessa]
MVTMRQRCRSAALWWKLMSDSQGQEKRRQLVLSSPSTGAAAPGGPVRRQGGKEARRQEGQGAKEARRQGAREQGGRVWPQS